MLLLFLQEEEFGDPWFPDLFAWRSASFLPLGLACLALVFFGGSAGCMKEGHITQSLQLAASRAPRKRRPRPEIPADLAPVWARLTGLAVKNHPLIAPFMQEATLERIDPKARLAEVSTGSAAAATVLMAGQNRYALQRHLRSIFHRPLMIRITCSK